MKKYSFGLILAVLFVGYSCEKKVSFMKVANFYTAMESSHAAIHDPAQKAIDFETNALQQVKNNNNALVDTRRMLVLVDSARGASYSRLAFLKSAREIDSEITLKNKTYQYDEMVYQACNNEMKTAIDLFLSDNPNKFQAISSLLQPRFAKIKEAEAAYLEAEKGIREKYDIKFAGSSK